jgi:imidazoleglycerol-phosphate dehydratase
MTGKVLLAYLRGINKKMVGADIKKVSDTEVIVERVTRESKIECSIDSKPRRQTKMDTGLAFLNHMIETLGWRMNLNIDFKYTTTNFKLTHVIAEDSGIVLGSALRAMFEEKLKKGVSGASRSMIDEGCATAAVSIEGRPRLMLEGNPMTDLTMVEDTKTCDLDDFLDGLALGLGASIRIVVESGKDPHHTWESIFRALGEALREAFDPNPWRAGTTAGVKGTLK